MSSIRRFLSSKDNLVKSIAKKTPEEVTLIAAELFCSDGDTFSMALLYEILVYIYENNDFSAHGSAWVDALGMICFNSYNEGVFDHDIFYWQDSDAFSDKYAKEIISIFKNALPPGKDVVDWIIRMVKYRSWKGKKKNL